jgi:pyridoxal phosphate enzyme (YggS family)
MANGDSGFPESMNVEQIRANLEQVQARIAAAARRSGRPAEAIRLVAVTKRVPAEWVRPLVACGARDLGENYPQELWRKAEALADLGSSVRWHLIGHLQSNKVKKTLPLVRLIHSVDSLKLLKTLDESVTTVPDPPGVCLQVNTSGEASKHGWAPQHLLEDAEAIAGCRAIRIVGLMTMAALGTTPETARGSFVRLRALREDLCLRTGLPLPELSMGMSSDFEAAIAEGATLVRIGSALFEGVEP